MLGQARLRLAEFYDWFTEADVEELSRLAKCSPRPTPRRAAPHWRGVLPFAGGAGFDGWPVLG